VRNQMGKESARPQALLYVVPKLCASAIWPFFKASPHPDWARYSRRGKPISSGITRCNDFAPEIEPRALGMGVLHPPGCCILMGVAFSWRCITRLSVLFRHFSSAGLSVLPSHRRVPPPLRSRELSLPPRCLLYYPAYPSSGTRAALPSSAKRPRASAHSSNRVGSLVNRPDVWKYPPRKCSR
jgi:hypothetical protein